MRQICLRASSLLLLAVTGCASTSQQATCQPASGTIGTVNWRSIVTRDDFERLRQWRRAWTQGLAKARSAGSDAEIAAEGSLLDPDVELPLQQPAPGAYRCRTIKIGAQSDGQLNYVQYPWFTCRISREDGTLRFTKIGGSQRPVGMLLPQTDRRMVFLGTLQLGDETNTLSYGRDRERDMAALLEQVGEQRWRLVFPYPHFESLIDVIELVPGGLAAQ